MATIGRNIRRFRLAVGIKTGKEFAAKLGVPPPRVSEWETNRYPLPDTATLIRIAKTVQRSVDEILAGIDPQLDRVMGLAKTRPGGEALTEEELELLNDFADIEDQQQKDIVRGAAREFAGRAASQAPTSAVVGLTPRVRDAIAEVAAAAAVDRAKRQRSAKPPRPRAKRG